MIPQFRLLTCGGFKINKRTVVMTIDVVTKIVLIGLAVCEDACNLNPTLLHVFINKVT